MAYNQPNMQQNMQAHDDLAALFSRNLNFNQDVRPSAPKEQPRQEPSPVPAFTEPIVYSISQHYTHSAHVARPSTQEATPSAPAGLQRPSSEPPQTDMVSSATILQNHGIDPSNLMPSQLELFQIADQPQQLRLMELWSICPPNRAENIPALGWSNTTLEQEEHLARMRYQRMYQEQGISLDGTPVQVGNGSGCQQSVPESEPYMASGYAELMRREQERQSMDSRPRDVYSHFGTSVGGPSYSPATDPVYMGADYARQQQQMDMASQYGAFEQFRGAGEMDAMDVM